MIAIKSGVIRQERWSNGFFFFSKKNLYKIEKKNHKRNFIKNPQVKGFGGSAKQNSLFKLLKKTMRRSMVFLFRLTAHEKFSP